MASQIAKTCQKLTSAEEMVVVIDNTWNTNKPRVMTPTNSGNKRKSLMLTIDERNENNEETEENMFEVVTKRYLKDVINKIDKALELKVDKKKLAKNGRASCRERAPSPR